MLAGHNGNLVAVYGETRATEISQQRSSKLTGRPSWAKGLTKDSDDRIRRRAELTSLGRKRALDEGHITIWSKGKTKETDPRVSAMAAQIKQDFAEGKRVAWHSGANALTDPRIKQKNEELKQRYTTGDLSPWHKGKTKNNDPRLDKAWKSRDPITEYEHIRWSDKEIEEQLQNNIQLALDRIENYRSDRKPALHVHCRGCDWSAKVALIFARNDRCPKCYPVGSNQQLQIAKWIESLGFVVGQNVRGIIGRGELDIYVPAKNLAIEFNGLYYHNEAAGKDQHYHQNKTDACSKLGIRLLHVFEDEWNVKPDIIKSIIANKLGVTSGKFGARDSIVVSLNPVERRTFFDSNHVDGDVHAIHTIGLRHKDAIVAAMSLREPFHRKHTGKLEVARFATITNTNVAGALSRLSKHAAEYAVNNGKQQIMSYVDTRFGSGNAWTKSGWKHTETTEPRFWWTDGHKRFNRFKFKADKSQNLTEAQVAEGAGVTKIWGCRNLLFELSLSPQRPTETSSVPGTPATTQV